MENTRLDNCYVAVQDQEGALEVAGYYPIEKLDYGATKSCFVLLDRPGDEVLQSTFSLTFHFTLCEVDGDEVQPGAEEEAALDEEVDLCIHDVLSPATHAECADFQKTWDQIGEVEESSTKLNLDKKLNSLQGAADTIKDHLAMSVFYGSDVVSAKAKNHTMCLAGVVCLSTRQPLLAKAKLFYTADGGVTLELHVRGCSEEARTLVLQSLE
jgi:hypothetical protein